MSYDAFSTSRANWSASEAYSLTGVSDSLIKLIATDFEQLSHILNNVLLHHKSVAKL
ncbi:MAG: hypothetical protein CBC34_001710 [Hyphomicrobiaceae bacterium TMED74]|nr:MAG: hypothetical protein CBC34_001710 [Hyphomicrobiaceae bacterium TMED74]